MNVIDNKKSVTQSKGRGGRKQNTGAEMLIKSHHNVGINRVTNTFNAPSARMGIMKTPVANFGGPGASSSSVKRSRYRSSTSYTVGATSCCSTPRGAGNLPIILAITEGRGDARGEVGIAAVNVQYPHLILAQISDRHTYVNTLTKILVFKPTEIVMPETMIQKTGTAGKLYECIKEKFQGLSIAAVSRKHFSNTDGLDRIRTLCTHEYSSVELYIKQKFYALAAAAALLKYVEYTQNIVYIAKSMKIEFQSSEDTTIIDIESAQSLELVTHQENSNKFTLLGVLDRCLTPGGKRYLRASILQPSCNEHIIKERQACVSEMVQDSTLLSSAQSLIRRLSDIDRLLVLGLNTPQRDNISTAEKNLNCALALKSTLEVIPSLRSALQTVQSNFLRKVLENLDDPRFALMMTIISEVLQPEARHVAGFNFSTLQRCFALKSGLNDMLDIARQAYCELIDDMKGLVETLALRYDLPFSLGCSASLGYHIKLESPRQKPIKINQIPPIFIEVQKHKNSYLMTTEGLLVLSQRCKDAREELHLMSNVMLKGMLNAIREHIGCLYQLSSDIAELDVIVSLASVSCLSNYTRPTFGARTELKSSMHPLMNITGTYVPVANDVYASLPHNINIITGPNMGGKSVYLRQIVMLQIMAQIGCYVPAEEAQFRIADRIFCRICFGDNIECNASCFVLEIKETQYILQMVTPKSLVIMDELCRGTTMEEGESIAFAICEQLINTTAFVFFTTHFLGLTRLAEWYLNVTNYHFGTMCRNLESSEKARLVYTHKLNPGIVSAKNYGLALAETSGIPVSNLNMAIEIAVKLGEKIKPVDLGSELAIAKAKCCYDEIAFIHRQIEDGKFNDGIISDVIARLRKRDVILDKENHTNDDEIIRTSQSSMLSMTERYNRRVQQRLLDTATSTSEYTARKLISEPKVGPSEIKTYDALTCPLPSKRFMLPNTPVFQARLTDEKILPDSGLQKPRQPVKFTPIQKSNSNNQCQQKIMSSPSTRKEIEPKDILNSLSNRFSPQSSCSDSSSVVELFSQISTETLKAKLSARQKEAEIFKVIEGDQFQESEFYGSVLPKNFSII